MAYSQFAYFYDKLQGEVDYTGIADFIDRQAERFGARREILLDMACGTGTLCEIMAKRGYDVIGTDASNEMLSCALDKKYDSGLPIQYLNQSMTGLDMFGTIDITVCTLDSINHLSSLDEIKTAFEKVSLFAFPDGMFIFDMNTLYKHREILGSNTYIIDTEGLYCVWQNEYSESDGSVDITLDFFEQGDDGRYERFGESFTEIAFDAAVIEQALIDAGFEILDSFDDYTDKPVTETTQRIVYVCKKKIKE